MHTIPHRLLSPRTLARERERQTTGAMHRITLARLQGKGTLPIDLQDTSELKAVRFPIDQITFYTAPTPDLNALMLIAQAVTDFRQKAGRIPRCLTVSMKRYASFIGMTGANRYYVKHGLSYRSVRLEWLAGLDNDGVLCEG